MLHRYPFLLRIRSWLKQILREKRSAVLRLSQLLSKANPATYIWNWIIESRPISGTISLCVGLSLSLNPFTLSSQTNSSLAIHVCESERWGVKRERPVHWANHANRASSCSCELWEREPSAALCSTAASAKTQYVDSKGPSWQQLSPWNNIIIYIILYAAFLAKVSTRTIQRGGGENHCMMNWKKLQRCVY